MARQYHNLVSGRIGPVVFYIKNGIGYGRARAWKVRQTKATRESAKIFGKSRTLGRLLRGQIVQFLPDLKNNEIKHRFDNAIMQWLRNDNLDGRREPVGYIDHHEFNQESRLHGRFKQPFSVDFSEKGKVHLTIPEYSIPLDVGAPAYTEKLQWHVLVTSCNLRQQLITDSAHRHFEISFTKGTVPEERISFDLKMTKGSLTLVTVALRYV